MARCVGLALATAALFAFATTTSAQTVQAYGFGGPAGVIEEDGELLAHVGGGAEILAPAGFGVSIEGGKLGKDGFWINHVSVDGTYHWIQRAQRIEPFVAAGYSRFFAEGIGVNTFNFGGGVNVWAHPRVALRIDVRDHVLPEPAIHLPSVRFGVTIR